MKKTLLATASMLLLSSAAFAADLPARNYTKAPPMVAAVHSWTGFYIGINAGYGGDRMAYPFSVAGTAGSANVTSSGVFGGGQIGYNWQSGNWVFGVESDIQVSDIKGRISASVPGVATASIGSDIEWFATARGRVGYAWDSVLLYVTGGYAYADVKSSATLTVPGAGAGSIVGNNDHHGWVVGGGIEYALSQKVTVKTEYQYLDLGSKTLAAGVVGSLSNDVTAHTVRAGLNWKF